jgi:hypothetical protein
MRVLCKRFNGGDDAALVGFFEMFELPSRGRLKEDRIPHD